MNRVFIKITRKQFMERYGHLRPNTYDITSKRYDDTKILSLQNKIKFQMINLNFQELHIKKLTAY